MYQVLDYDGNQFLSTDDYDLAEIVSDALNILYKGPSKIYNGAPSSFESGRVPPNIYQGPAFQGRNSQMG